MVGPQEVPGPHDHGRGTIQHLDKPGLCLNGAAVVPERSVPQVLAGHDADDLLPILDAATCSRVAELAVTRSKAARRNPCKLRVGSQVGDVGVECVGG